MQLPCLCQCSVKYTTVHGKYVLWCRATYKTGAVVPGGHKHARHKKVTRSYQKGAIKTPGTHLDADDVVRYKVPAAM